MQRYTEWVGNSNDEGEHGELLSGVALEEALIRLAHYEDTGKTPFEIEIGEVKQIEVVVTI